MAAKPGKSHFRSTTAGNTTYSESGEESHSYTYDAAGNRTNMSDETGSLAYSYDELSRIKTETKDFADTLTYEPTGGYVLVYTYHLTGGIKSIVTPFEFEIRYSVDKTGRVTAVGDASSSTAYASSVTFRAFGGLKSMSLSAADPIDVSMTYDNALRPAGYQAHSDANTGDIHNAAYSYHNDGKLTTLDNNGNLGMDQSNKYDFAGRLKINDLGNFKQTMSYDHFDNLTNRYNETYSFEPTEFTAEFTNNRKTSSNSSSTYDAAGNVTGTSNVTLYGGSNISWKIDAAGRQKRWEEFGPYDEYHKKGGETTFDGDGRPVKRAVLSQTKTGGVWGSWSSVNWYTISSSVTGQTITELVSNGALLHDLVYLGDNAIARTSPYYTYFKLTAPLTGSERTTDHDGVIFTNDSERSELAANGVSVPLTAPQAALEPNYKQGGSPFNPEDGCQTTIDGPNSCVTVFRIKRKVVPGKNSLGMLTDVNYSGSNNAYAYGKKATGDPKDKDKEKPDECPPGDGPCVVKAEPDIIDMTFAPGDLVPIPLPANFKTLVKEQMETTQPGKTMNCDTFLKNVIAKVIEDGNLRQKEALSKGLPGSAPYSPYKAHADSGLDLLNKVSKYSLNNDVRVGGRGAGGTTKGSIPGGDAEVIIQQKYYSLPMDRDSNPIKMWTRQYVHTAIHELAHLSSNFSTDGNLAQAAFDLGYTKTKPTDPGNNTTDAKFNHSKDWGDILAPYCGNGFSY